ncbi:hypothetical protein [Nocardia sp. NBC_00416]|uniref:hypothetical protein n=1 Tax=Nocardia sp. NBC_00416 TaxID=2975991 RepID=UPI003FA55892
MYRTLLLSVEPGTPQRVLEDFEADLLRMPRYIPAIRAWQLSRVTRAGGTSRWTRMSGNRSSSIWTVCRGPI